MSGFTEYVFHFKQSGEVVRIPYAKWKRIREGEVAIAEYAGQVVYIAYAYLLLKNRKPDYCPRIEGAIYYFDKAGNIISGKPYYFDLFQDCDEEAGGMISFEHRKKKKEVADKYCWKLKPDQIQKVINCIWP